jgi:7-cyano-7-deazaguanine synthase
MHRYHHVVVYSGGMDSFTLLHRIIAQNAANLSRVHAISFDYGQRHSKELGYARRTTKHLGIDHQVINLRDISPLLQGSALTTPSIAVPEGHYEAESMRQTVVPGRNTIMLSLAMGWAESLLLQAEAAERAQLMLEPRNAEQTQAIERLEHRAIVYYGAHSGDHHIYPDCRPGYFEAMQLAFRQATDNRVLLMAPYLHNDKAAILYEGIRGLGLDYSRSWTCYKGDHEPCGKCGACQERAEAFAAVGQPDPLLERPPLLG